MIIDFDDTYEFPVLTQRAPETDQLIARSERSVQRIHQLTGSMRRHLRLMMDRADYQKEIERLRKVIRDRELDDMIKGLFVSKRARNTAYGLMFGCFCAGMVISAVLVRG